MRHTALPAARSPAPNPARTPTPKRRPELRTPAPQFRTEALEDV
ncbi:hypothetical protein ACQEU8_05170 [Streptomyces sp. CA-250714]